MILPATTGAGCSVAGVWWLQEKQKSKVKIRKNEDLLKEYQKVAINSDVAFFQKYLTESLPKGVWLKDISVNYVDTPHKENRKIVKKSQKKKPKDADAVQTISVIKPQVDQLPRPTIIFSGFAYAEDPNQQIKTINSYVTQLRNDPNFMQYFDEIGLGPIQSQTMEGKTVSPFDISCR